MCFSDIYNFYIRSTTILVPYKVYIYICNGLWNFKYSLVYRRTQLNKKCDYLYTETNNKQKKNDEAKSKNNNTT